MSDNTDRRQSWFAGAEATVAVIIAVVGLAVSGVIWGGHIDSQVQQSKLDISNMSGRNDALVESMDKLRERLIIVEIHQTDQLEELHKQGLTLNDINANLHRIGR